MHDLLRERRRRRRAARASASEALARALQQADALQQNIRCPPAPPPCHSGEQSGSDVSSGATGSARAWPTREATSRDRARRRASWGHSGDDGCSSKRCESPDGSGAPVCWESHDAKLMRCDSARCISSGERHRSLEKAKSLEAALAACEAQLAVLERRGRSPPWLLPMPSPPAKPGMEDTGNSSKPYGTCNSSLRLEFKDLGCRLEDIAAEALQCSCSREVPGAMDIFEQANCALDNLARAIEGCRDASMARQIKYGGM